MIFLDLSEGLGNQMFQYAFGRYLQNVYGTKLYLNTSSFKHNVNNKSYSLKHLYLNENVVVPKNNVRIPLNIYSKAIRFFVRKILRINPYSEEYYFKMISHGFYMSSQVFKYLNVPKTNKRNIFVLGSWQSNKYFLSINDKIKNELRVKTEPNDRNKEYIRDIQNCESVCVHIRLGDYTSPQWSHLHVCTPNYYLKGMDYIASKNTNPVFYVFSNTSADIKWIKENYNFQYSVIYVDLDNPDYEDIRLMYNCKHFVISNSTFSWWAQFLSENNDKIVVAPNKWQKEDEKNALDIYLDNWKLIETE